MAAFFVGNPWEGFPERLILFQPPFLSPQQPCTNQRLLGYAWLLMFCLLGSLGKQSWHGYRNQLHGRSSCEYYPISNGRSPAYGKTEGGLLPISHLVGNWPGFTTNLLLTTSVLACMSNYKLGLSILFYPHDVTLGSIPGGLPGIPDTYNILHPRTCQWQEEKL